MVALTISAFEGTSKLREKLEFSPRMTLDEVDPSENFVVWPRGPNRDESNDHSFEPLAETSSHGSTGKASGVGSKGSLRAFERVPRSVRSRYALSTVAWL